MRLGTPAVAVALCCGCSAQISDGLGPSVGSIGAGPDAGADPTGDGSTTPACASRAVYLSFDGQKLTRGPSDAIHNQASWMTIDQATVPPYQATNPDRDAAIRTIFDGVRAQLAQFPIDVTVTRPTSGSYVMIVFGGRARQVGSDFGSAVTALDCGDLRPDDVAWISDTVSPAQAVVNSAIGAIGFGLGLTATSDPRDCLCGWDNDCVSDDSAPCRLGSPIDRDPMAIQLCPDRTPQDEVAAFRAAFCH
jgi:hypothetical protein